MQIIFDDALGAVTEQSTTRAAGSTPARNKYLYIVQFVHMDGKFANALTQNRIYS